MADDKSEVFRSNSTNEVSETAGRDTKRKPRVEGPTELRQVTDHHATGTAGGQELAEVDIAKHAGDAFAEPVIATQADEIQAPVVAPAAAPAAPPILIKKEDAIPWALSIHLEERIKGLGSKTAAVNQELDKLEAASQILAKRIGK